MSDAPRLDDLTRLPLRSAFLDAATTALAEARAHGEPVSLLVMDVDHFKLVNDTWGHLQGDAVLLTVADLLRGNLRADDVAARYAGDEFVALLPHTTPERAREVAERICQAVRAHSFALREDTGTLNVTLSVGVATFPEHGTDPDALFAAADRALYQVKRQGRDGVAAAAAGGEQPAHMPFSIERFVGRGAELRTLVRFLEDSVAGRPKVVAISGEAGVGKTTLLRQLEPEVRLRGGSLVIGRSFEADVRPPYGPWAEALTAIRRSDRSGTFATREWRELPRIVPSLGEPAAARGGGKYQLLDELAEFLRLAAAQRPRVVVLDDMQWADSASWDVLEYLIPQLEGERILFCLTIRAEELVGETLERRRRVSRSERYHELSLERLSRDDMRQWMEAAFHRHEIGRELLAFVYRHTEGNPLFVVQVLRTLVDEGAIWHSGKQWEWRAVSELRLPVAVGDLVSRRLARLSPQALAVLTTAAVIGREFDVDLALDADVGDEDELLDAIDEGVKASVLEPANGAREADRWAFSHGLLAEVLRDGLQPRRRARVHQRVAQALERRTPDAHAAIATHYDRAGDAERSHRYALLAAADARAVHAYQEGTDFLRIAERHAATPAQLADVREHLAEMAEASGRYAEAEELCDLAIEWFAGQGDQRRAIVLRLMRARVRSLLGEPMPATLAECLALDAAARAGGFDIERVRVLLVLSQGHGRLGDLPAAQVAARECVQLAERCDDPRLLADALLRLAVTIEHDDVEQAIALHRRALALYEGAGDLRGQANAHSNLGKYHTFRGEWAEAKEAFGASIELGRRVMTPDTAGIFVLNLGVVHLKCGEHERARDLFGEALALFAAVRNGERQLYALYNLAHLERELGEPEAAAELYEATAALAHRLGHAEIETGAAAGAGLARLGLGQVAEARAVEQVVRAALERHPAWFQGRELPEALLFRLAAAAGDGDVALAHYRQASALLEPVDLYAAAWLAAECGETLLTLDPAFAREALDHFAPRVRAAGFGAMQVRYEALMEKA